MAAQAQNEIQAPAESHPAPLAANAGGAERRTARRFTLDETVAVHPISGATKLQGRISDLSAGGCRLEIDTRLLTGAMLRVELQFQIHGYTFRLVGVTAGRRTKTSIGIRFVDLSERRRAELAELLAVLEDKSNQSASQPSTAAEIKQAVQPSQPIQSSASSRLSAPQVSPQAARQASASRTLSAPASAVFSPADATAEARDRRAFRRHKVDTRARLYLVNTGICMTGSIQDLSMAGCRIVTEEPFNVGIYVRLEAEFFLHGLPFRLGGVSQAIINRNTLGVRFLDMSDRKREQLAELIAEIHEAHAQANTD